MRTSLEVFVDLIITTSRMQSADDECECGVNRNGRELYSTFQQFDDWTGIANQTQAVQGHFQALLGMYVLPNSMTHAEERRAV